MASDARITVADDRLRHSVRPDDVVHERGCEVGGSGVLARRSEVLQFACPLDEHLDGVVATLGQRQSGDCVGRPFLARALRQRQRHEQSGRGLLTWLVALARVTGQHVLLRVARHAVPLKSLLQRSDEFVAAEVCACGGVMTLC